jgi:hypothetical protein
MSSFSGIDDHYINPSNITHISYSKMGGAEVHFTNGTSVRVTTGDADTIVSEMDTNGLSSRIEQLTNKLEGRLDDIISTLATISDKL